MKNKRFYFFCEECNGVYTMIGKREVIIAKLYSNVLPRVMEEWVKESKLCKECLKENRPLSI
jgi:hypothetical protein